MTKENELIIRASATNVYELSQTELQELAVEISHNINISKFRSKIMKVIMDLSHVGSPNLYSNAREIAIEDEKRLELIYQLAYNLSIFEGWVNNVRKNKYDCINNYDAMCEMLLKTQDLMRTVIKYSNFKKSEIQKVQSQIEENKRFYLDR